MEEFFFLVSVTDLEEWAWKNDDLSRKILISSYAQDTNN